MPLIVLNKADIRSIPLKNKRLIKKFIVEIFHIEKKPLKEVQIVFCSDEYLLVINQNYLKHNFFTDIITFDLSAGEATEGEMYISIDRVKENAKGNSSRFGIELLRVIFHGALHLCGYNDKKKSEITIMRGKEDYYLQLYNSKYK